MVGWTLEKIARRSSWKIWSWHHQSVENLDSFSIVSVELCEERAALEVMLFINCCSFFVPCPVSQTRRSEKVLVTNLTNEIAYTIRKMTVMSRGEGGRSMIVMMKHLNENVAQVSIL
jgi:hypothetical protein